MQKALYIKADRFYAPGFEMYVDRKWIETPCPTHWHDYCELEMVLSGQGTHIFNGRQEEIRENYVYLMTPLDFHSLSPRGSIQLFHVQFSCSVPDASLMQRITRLQTRDSGIAVQTDPAAGEKLRALLKEMEWEFTARREDSVPMLRCCLDRLCMLILREAEKGESLQPPGGRDWENSAVSRAIQYVQYHFRSPVTLAEAAAQAHLSENYFGELFHRYMGMTFSRYLRSQRLAFAVHLLGQTDMNIAEIAGESGFRSPAYFAEIFKDEYGITPTQFKKERKNVT